MLDRLLAANRRYAEGFAHGDAQAPPRLGVAVVTCMDARIVPHRLLGLQEGDAHVIRNAGGRVSDDAVRSLIVSSRLLGTRLVLVIQHTGCGMMGLDEDALREDLESETGAPVPFDLLAFDDLEQSVRRDVERLRSEPHLAPGVRVHGFVYEVETGRLREVE